MSEDQKKQLEQQLWNIANELRGKMNADEFRDYCLGFIFFKYLSERLYNFANEILVEDGIDFVDIDEESEEGQDMLNALSEEAIENLGYFLKPSELFSSIARRGAHKADKQEQDKAELSGDRDNDIVVDNFILGDLDKVLASIERSTMGKESEDDFDHLFEDLDLSSTKLGRTEKAKNALIAKILVHLASIDFRLEDSESDVLGDAYEYLIGQFASGAGKKAGEFYTPQSVSTILAKIVTNGKSRLKSVYDPTCGSGSLLLRVAKEVDHVGDFYGQEMNRTTFNLARMNMILHGVHYRNFDLKQEDTLESPQHSDKRFEAVVANPPFSAKWSAHKLFESDDRFAQYGKLAPASKADFAFVQHMLYQLDDNGTMAVVLPHGVLFRGAAEGHIRRYIIEDQNWLDAVIGLPANIFYGTSIPTCILVLKKCRENPNDVLFIDASGSDYFAKGKNQNTLRPQDIKKIVDTYRNRTAEEKYSHKALISEIKDNDFNLNIPRYVDTFEEEEEIDLNEVTKKIKQIDKDMLDIDKAIQGFCNELGIEAPL
ncbi:type I restriction-modification system subunit M [Vibrio penaeicida]|uniref:type I restriction-modification system subunit M n=1 Tax=Vibrio penaeicida TaxID=104609 RepID=UPI002732C0A9|nr:type I restriction-modification system subunit M [Vibrio penaeicida]MDP2570792.1 type I restriction-modification system subunit M [Vibrio penaeicida]